MIANPVCIGTGLVALDVVISNDPTFPTQFFAGGSCGNVITILAYLGWSTYPIARLSNNVAADMIIKDLTRWNVKDDLLTVSEDGSTPVIIHRITKDHSGNPKHRFEFKNPENGEYLPSYKPCLAKSVNSILEKVTHPNVFYFDRINRASIDLAKSYKKQGAIIFFEPSSNKDLKGFNECVEVADIVKFSNDRIKNYEDIFAVGKSNLEIQTFGADGLKFRTKGELRWTKNPSFLIDYSVDAAGAGDWCTAGIIFKLFNKKNNIEYLSKLNILKALQFGQALSALNCSFEGARGLMYNMTKTELLLSIQNILSSAVHKISTKNNAENNHSNASFMKISSLFATV